jgi:dihydrofolate reductase
MVDHRSTLPSRNRSQLHSQLDNAASRFAWATDRRQHAEAYGADWRHFGAWRSRKSVDGWVPAASCSSWRIWVALPRPKGQKMGKMGKVIVINHLTLDGVMQGPGRPGEDTRDGFERGGWGIPHSDEAMVAKMGERMGGDRAFLFGRRTYEELLASWNAQGGPFKDALNNARKYVASSNPETRLDWPNSTLLRGDIPATVGDLKQSSGTNLVIMGSGVLIGSLMAADLIDEYLLMIHPLVLGTGRRLFPGGTQASLRLVDSMTTSTGVLIATYEAARG